jgi:arsenate reductase
VKTRALVLCTGNSARSQMAEGLLRSLDPMLEVESAGTAPAALVHPAALEAMAEIGIDIRAAQPKSVDRFLTEPFDFVITVCDSANETCPHFSGNVRHRVHLGFEDPAQTRGSTEEILNAFRRIRDQIRDRLGDFYQTRIRTSMLVSIRTATPRDLNDITSLLKRSNLPVEGLEDQFGDNYAVAESASRIVGSAGIEIYGDDGLLRSLAVDESMRSEGVGDALFRFVVRDVSRRGLKSLYLLTTTAAGYFERRGFTQIDRDQAPPAIKASREFAELCPSTSTAMMLGL